MENKKTKEQWEFDENEVSVDETEPINQTIFSADSWFVGNDKDSENNEAEADVDEKEKTIDNSSMKTKADDTKNAKVKGDNNGKNKKIIFVISAVVLAVVLAIVGVVVGIMFERNSRDIVFGSEVENLNVVDAKLLLKDYHVWIDYMYSSTVPAEHVISTGDTGWEWNDDYDDYITMHKNTDYVSLVVSAGNYGSQYLYSNEDPGEAFVYTEGNFFKTWYQNENDDVIGEGLDWCDWDTFYGTHYEELAGFDAYDIPVGAYEIADDYYLCIEKWDGWYRTWYEDGDGNFITDGLDQADWDELYYTHYEELANHYAFDISVGAYEISENYFLCIDKAKYQYQPDYEIYD